MKKLSLILLNLGVLLSMLHADETSGTQKFINNNRDVLLADAIFSKTNAIMKKLTDEYDFKKKLESKDIDLMLQKAHQECTNGFETKEAKELCINTITPRVFRAFTIAAELSKRELYIDLYNQGNELICKFFTINGKEVRIVINKRNSKLYKNANFIKDDILTDIGNCELKDDSKK